MTRKPKAALLPLYLKLYDDSMPKVREVFDPWLATVASRLEACGLEIVLLPVCRVASEFAAAVAEAEEAGADVILTLHLAYSPSLEAIDALTGTPLSVVMIDTTMDYDFGRHVDTNRLMYNHGVHGVQDLASMMRRRGKAFEVVAGHFEQSDVLARAADLARAAVAAKQLGASRVLRIGPPFAGMGDFHVAEKVLKGKLGIKVTQIAAADLGSAASGVTSAMIDEEMALDAARFDVQAPSAAHRRSVRVGLAVRAFLEQGKFDAFSANFLAFESGDEPIDTMPFLEIAKSMQRGLGYAGEGDVLTAAMVGALLAGWPRTTFTEIFCADWKGGALFLSHMGEVNPAVAGARPVLFEKDFPWTPAKKPVVLTCAPEPGPAVLVNLAPWADDEFCLIVAPVEVLEDGTHPNAGQGIRGWIQPELPVAPFLEEYSRLGGTHHSALVLGKHAEAMAAMGRMAGLHVRVLK